MNQPLLGKASGEPITHSGLRAFVRHRRLLSDRPQPEHLARELALSGDEAGATDLVRAAKMIGLKARVVLRPSPERLGQRAHPGDP